MRLLEEFKKHNKTYNTELQDSLFDPIVDLGARDIKPRYPVLDQEPLAVGMERLKWSGVGSVAVLDRQ